MDDAAAFKEVIPRRLWRSNWFEMTSRRMQLARSNCALLSKTNRPIATVGQTCMCDELAQRWGYSAFTIDGPFTAALYHGEGPSIALRENFAALNDASNVKLIVLPGGLDCPTVPVYNAIYSHEAGPYWVADGLQKFFSLYRTRVENFMRACEHPEPVFVFVQDSQTDLHRLIGAIEQVASSNAWRLLVIDLREHGDGLRLSDSRVRTIVPKIPSDEYLLTWHLPETFNTEAAFAFERDVTSAVVEEAA